MKNKLKSLNFILAVLLVLVLGTGCGRQKAIELPTSDEAVVAASEAAASQSETVADKTASSVDKSQVTEDKPASSIDESQASENKANSFDDASGISIAPGL